MRSPPVRVCVHEVEDSGHRSLQSGDDGRSVAGWTRRWRCRRRRSAPAVLRACRTQKTYAATCLPR